MNDLTVNDVMRHLKSGRFHVHRLRSKDKHLFRSSIWRTPVFQMIYQKTNQRNILMRSFYYCTMCQQIIHLIQGASGNSKLTRHACYKNYVASNKIKRKVEDVDDEDDESNLIPSTHDLTTTDSIKYAVRLWLARVFNDFRALCMKPECSRITAAHEFEEIVPNTWSEVDWYHFMRNSHRLLSTPNNEPCPKSAGPSVASARPSVESIRSSFASKRLSVASSHSLSHARSRQSSSRLEKSGNEDSDISCVHSQNQWQITSNSSKAAKHDEANARSSVSQQSSSDSETSGSDDDDDLPLVKIQRQITRQINRLKGAKKQKEINACPSDTAPSLEKDQCQITPNRSIKTANVSVESRGHQSAKNKQKPMAKPCPKSAKRKDERPLFKLTTGKKKMIKKKNTKPVGPLMIVTPDGSVVSGSEPIEKNYINFPPCFRHV